MAPGRSPGQARGGDRGLSGTPLMAQWPLRDAPLLRRQIASRGDSERLDHEPTCFRSSLASFLSRG
jgi:hypothetical protein